MVTPMSAITTSDEHRALQLISAESTGCPEHLLIADGFSPELLGSLVRSGLAGVTSERRCSGATEMVFRLWVTKRGMQALQAGSRH
jgi:hypothetical protein